MSGKRKRTAQKRKSRSVTGIPGVGLDIGLEWLLTNISNNSKLGEIARAQFEGLINDCVVRLLDIALPSCPTDTVTKDWAGRILARVDVSLEAHLIADH